MSDTPLSDAISRLTPGSRPVAFESFIEIFRAAQVGVAIRNVPPDLTPGQTIPTGGDVPVSFALVTTPDGRPMIKACAEPDVFTKRFPDDKIKGLMSGQELLEIAAETTEIDGILVCSATSFHSVPINRADAVRFTKQLSPESARPWWRLW